jgi:hypothetical protein
VRRSVVQAKKPGLNEVKSRFRRKTMLRFKSLLDALHWIKEMEANGIVQGPLSTKLYGGESRMSFQWEKHPGKAIAGLEGKMLWCPRCSY